MPHGDIRQSATVPPVRPSTVTIDNGADGGNRRHIIPAGTTPWDASPTVSAGMTRPDLACRRGGGPSCGRSGHIPFRRFHPTPRAEAHWVPRISAPWAPDASVYVICLLQSPLPHHARGALDVSTLELVEPSPGRHGRHRSMVRRRSSSARWGHSHRRAIGSPTGMPRSPTRDFSPCLVRPEADRWDSVVA